MEAILQNAAVVRRTDLTATANGSIKATGSLKELQISGALVVGPAENDLPSRLPPGVVDLDVVHVNRGSGEAAPGEVKDRRSDSPPVPVQLGLKLTLNRQVYVRGRGLDSEWRGALDVQGTALEPILTGNLQIVRGRFEFLDRSFSLTQGAILFHGSSPPVPYLDFTAESKTKDITAILKISGLASTPQIEMTSEPPFHERKSPRESCSAGASTSSPPSRP